MSDAFVHHPGLRGKIKPFSESMFRSFSMEQARALVSQYIDPDEFFFSDEVREEKRLEALATRPDGDVWIFGYGSLMWDPAMDFAEVRRAFAPAYERKFILVDRYGGRGTPEAPGLIAALDDGMGCHGLAFRLRDEDLEEETKRLFLRENSGRAYHATWIGLETDHGPLTGLAFVVDHDAPLIDGDVSRADQVRYAATGAGAFGTTLEYIANLAEHFAELNIEDEEVESLLAEARAYGR